MTVNNYKVEDDGIWISREDIVNLKKHYEDVQRYCLKTNSERLAKYYEAKVDILNDILNIIKEEMKVIKTKATVV